MSKRPIINDYQIIVRIPRTLAIMANERAKLQLSNLSVYTRQALQAHIERDVASKSQKSIAL